MSLINFGVFKLRDKKIPSASTASSLKADPALLRQHVTMLTTNSKPRNYLNTDILDEVADKIAAVWKEEGLKVEFQTFQTDGKRYKNVITSLGPSEGPRIIVGAHYDVCGEGPGADDNASGVAGLLELARLLKAQIKAQKSPLKNRIDLVAYTLEEPPFFGTDKMGSAIHAQSLKKVNTPVKLMLSLEMIGYFSEKENSQQYPLSALKYVYPTKGNFIGVVGRLDSVFLTRKVRSLMKKHSHIDVQFINAPRSLNGVDLSDHRNYWEADYPALMITDTAFFRNPHYHTLNDTVETLDFQKMAEVVNGVYGVLQEF